MFGGRLLIVGRNGLIVALSLLVSAGYSNAEVRVKAKNQSMVLQADTVMRPTLSQGQELFTKKGCVACHAVDAKTPAKIAPTLDGILGSRREFVDGSTAIADEAYVRQSIIAPADKVVKGFQPVMPSYAKILAENEMESIVLYIKSL